MTGASFRIVGRRLSRPAGIVAYLIDDKVGSDAHTRQITHVSVDDILLPDRVTFLTGANRDFSNWRRQLWGLLDQRPFWGEERKTFAPAECFSV